MQTFAHTPCHRPHAPQEIGVSIRSHLVAAQLVAINLCDAFDSMAQTILCMTLSPQVDGVVQPKADKHVPYRQ